jgi:hypothetical protein
MIMSLLGKERHNVTKTDGEIGLGRGLKLPSKAFSVRSAALPTILILYLIFFKSIRTVKFVLSLGFVFPKDTTAYFVRKILMQVFPSLHSRTCSTWGICYPRHLDRQGAP